MIGRVPTKLAIQNAARNPRRTGSTAAALMIGIALVTTTLVVGESAILNHLPQILEQALQIE